MLIDSSRLTARDREHWARLVEHYDDALSADPRLDRLEAAARRAVTEFLAAGPAYISVSWGKDSVVAAHIALSVDPGLPVRWVRQAHFEAPETALVRDVFLTGHPQARYEEITVQPRNPKRGEPGFDERAEDPDADHQDILAETLSGRWISGVRAEESRIRRISIGHRGLVTRNTCRPIGDWTAVQVFAYLHREGLPVHPVYAMTAGGYYDRRWLRVHPLCQALSGQSAVHGRDVETWENMYFPDVIAAALRARAHMWRR